MSKEGKRWDCILVWHAQYIFELFEEICSNDDDAVWLQSAEDKESCMVVPGQRISHNRILSVAL